MCCSKTNILGSLGAGTLFPGPFPHFSRKGMTALAPALLLLLVIVQEKLSQKADWSQGQETDICLHMC